MQTNLYFLVGLFIGAGFLTDNKNRKLNFPEPFTLLARLVTSVLALAASYALLWKSMRTAVSFPKVA